jgi:hypothetical protein
VSLQDRDTAGNFLYAGHMAESRNESPNERAPAILLFGELAPRIAALVRGRPRLLARLFTAPREHVHAIAIFLHLAPEAGRPDDEVAELILATHPRDLLHAALPIGSPLFYRALDRAGDRVRDKRFYERLGTLGVGPFAGALLKDGRIDDARLSYYEALSRMDSSLTGLQSVLDGDTYLAEAVDCLVALLRSHSALRKGDLHLPPKAGKAAVARRLRAALGRIQAPDPGFVAPSPFRLVRSSDELQHTGRTLGNCVAIPEWNAARYQIQLIQGSTVFLVADDPPLLTSLIRVADGAWYLEQLCGPKNAAPPAGVRAALIRDLTAAGQRIVMTQPDAALGRLVQEGQRRRAAVDDDLEDDGEEDEGEDGIAA